MDKYITRLYFRPKKFKGAKLKKIGAVIYDGKDYPFKRAPGHLISLANANNLHLRTSKLG